MKRLSLVIAATMVALAGCSEAPTAPSPAPVTLRDVQVSDVNGQAIPVAIRGGSLTISQCLGDFDNDGDVDIVDIQRIAFRWNARVGDPLYAPLYDIDGDGDMDIVTGYFSINRPAQSWVQVWLNQSKQPAK